MTLVRTGRIINKQRVDIEKPIILKWIIQFKMQGFLIFALYNYRGEVISLWVL